MSKIKGVKKTAPSMTFQDRLQMAYHQGLVHGYEVARDTAITQVMDVALVTNHEDMGISPNKNGKFLDAFDKNWEEFTQLAKEDEKADPSKAYTKHILDERLKAAVPADRFVPFHERYKYDLDGDFIPEKIRELVNDKN